MGEAPTISVRLLRRRQRGWAREMLIAVVISWASVAQAAGGSVDDLVVTTDGARLRGVIVENDPNGLVKILEPDGQTRSFERAQIRYAGPAVSGPPEAAEAALPAASSPQLDTKDSRFFVVSETTVFQPDVGYVEGTPIITLGGKQVSQREFLRIAAPRIGRDDLWTRDQVRLGSGIALLLLAPAAIAAGAVGIANGATEPVGCRSGDLGNLPWQFWAGIGGALGGAGLVTLGVMLLVPSSDAAWFQDIAAKYNAQVASGSPGAALQHSGPPLRLAIAPVVSPGATGMQLSLSF
jgi:hypothetical protein